MDSQTVMDYLVFQRLPKQTIKTSFTLLSRFISPAALFHAEDLSDLPESMRQAILAIQTQGREHALYQQAQAIIAQAEQHKVQIITLDDVRYPALLKETHQPPLLLYVKGDAAVLSALQLGVVGARKSTVLANKITFSWCDQLAQAGLVITSGLALGIDGFAHQGALHTNGKTIAVLAHGLDSIYPRSHKKLADEIIEQGALVSEFAFNEPAKREYFPQRNRIISGLSLGILVAEAALRSGSLITARYAMEQNRDVFAIPGALSNIMAKGCHHLIKQGALLVESADDILQALALPLKFNCINTTLPTLSHLSPLAENILQQLAAGALHINELMALCSEDMSQLASELTLLELDGMVAQQQGVYQKILI